MDFWSYCHSFEKKIGRKLALWKTITSQTNATHFSYFSGITANL